MAFDHTFLVDLLGDDRVSTGEDTREAHATDWGTPPEDGTRPDAVVYPTSTDEVSAVLAAATERGVPVTPYAAGTSLEGNAVPARGGVSMNLTRMDAVRNVRPEDFQIDVEPGVMGPTIEDVAGQHGLFFPPLPSSGEISTIGGMIANAASGMQTVRYGEVADWVLELEVVLADGSVVTAGSKAVKSSSGYNLRDLFVGSEGTLGVVTRATLELEGRPAQIERARTVDAAIVERALAVGGTATGEHGIGLGKRGYLVDEHSGATVDAMRAVKRALDPTDTLNPGKVFPETIDGKRVLADPPDDG